MLSPLDAALTPQFAKNTQHDSSKVLRLPRNMKTVKSKVLRMPRKLKLIFWKRHPKYCACHAKQLSTSYETRLNLTKCHACHAKRDNATLETSKSDPCCRTYHMHGHTALTRTVAHGCERLRPVAVVNATSSEHTLQPNGNPCYVFGNNFDHILIIYVYPLQIYVNIFSKYVQMLDPVHLNIYRIRPGFHFSPLPRSSAMVLRASPPPLKICRAVLYSDQEMWHLADVGMQFWSVFLMRMK